MALFGFNKQKVLASAEKYVQQGKLQNAIAEYEKILKNDPKDLTVTNTVGDLYSRIGESDKATGCFKSVGDAYATQGFTVKAIAMYKKISKLKPSLDSLLKLAELYTQQGLLNDARAQYQQIADEFQKAGEWENAARIYQKILEMDPENGKMRVQLAEVYVRLGKKADAWQIFTTAAESMRAKGSLSGAEEILQRMLTLDPGNTYALLMQGKNLLESGDAAAAVAALQKVPDIDSNPDALRDLLKAYLLTGQLSEAGTAASKLLTIHNDLSAISSFADALMQAGQYENALQVIDQHAERLLAENSEKVLNHLHVIIGHVRENPDSLEKLLELFNKAGETTHVSEVLELLAHASVQSGDLTRARDLYQKLAQIEPQNPLHMQNYQQVVSRLGGTSGAKLITPEEAVVLIDDLEATAPAIHQHYSDEVSLAVRSALTDAELFISYNMPAKALGPLLTALPMAPKDLRINQRLAALHTRAGRFAEAAICCRTLQALYSEAEYPDEATRYSELAERYEERSATPAMAPEEEAHIFLDSQPLASQAEESGEAQEEIQIAEPEFSVDAGSGEDAATESEESSHTSAAAESAWPAASTHTAEEMAVTPAEPDVPVLAVSTPEGSASAAEIDLSSEWDDTVTVEDSAAEEAESVPAEQASADAVHAHADRADDSAADRKAEETIEEIRFYIAHGMPEQAMATLARLQTLTSDHAKLDEIRSEVDAAVEAAQQARAQHSTPRQVAEVAEDITVEEVSVDEIPSAESVEEAVAEAPEVEEPVAKAQAPAVEIPVSEPAAIEASVEPEPEPAEPQNPPGILTDFVSDLESSLGDSFLAGKPAAQKKPEPAAPAASKPVPAPAKVVSAPAAPVMGKFVADLEAGPGQDFQKARPVPEAPATRAPKPAAQAPAVSPKPAAAVPAPAARVETPLVASAAASASSAASVVPQPSASVAWAPLTEAPISAAPIAHAPAAPGTSKESPFGEEAGVDLAEMFGELKQDLEAGVAASEEDPETHYNLGIAFREMGLLDEAIGELQKACQSFDRGHPFPQVMQTYTWLAQCFLDKGVPEAAVRWYQKALAVPTIDGETRVALNYELASAYETAGDKASALKYFMEVYGSNIDYRDVAERIKALKS
jgi:tetratricopeptide (TPR) repeat protein